MSHPKYEFYPYGDGKLVRTVDGIPAICTCGKLGGSHLADGSHPCDENGCKGFELDMAATLLRATIKEGTNMKSALGPGKIPLCPEDQIAHFETILEKFKGQQNGTPREIYNLNLASWQGHSYYESQGADWFYVSICKNLGLKPMSQEEWDVQNKVNQVKWEDALTEVFNCKCRRILLVGPPGTGKTTTTLILTGTKWRITMTEGTCVEELIGMFQLINGETVWVDGPMTAAMREGSPLLIDEIDHHGAEIGSLLYAAADDHPQIMLPTKEMVVAQEGYALIGTSNSNISALPEAIIDRMEAVILAISPHPDAMKDMQVEERAAVVNHFRALDKTPWRWNGKPTLRRMASFSRLRKTSKLSEDILANIVFGTSGKEIMSALATAAATPAKVGG